MKWICANNLNRAETHHHRCPPQGDGFRRGTDHAQNRHRGAPLPILRLLEKMMAACV
ncbi:MAG: hypothetical protein GY862_00905 [Gammaproteobacteria bacterium]|nr:hypothetical protein [Gammaproteobacteria bacterium]